jgi:hypothetical protein
MKNNLKALPETITVQIQQNETVDLCTYVPEYENEIIEFYLQCADGGSVLFSIYDPATGIGFNSGVGPIGNLNAALVPHVSSDPNNQLKAGQTYILRAENVSNDPSIVTFTITMSVYEHS